MSGHANGPAHASAPAQLRVPGSESPHTTAGGRSRPLVHVALSLAGALLLIGLLAWPMLFTGASFNEDWGNHFWYMWHQSLAIRAGHLPSLFLNYSGGLLYPYYAFYGGTLYALTGALSLILGDAPIETYVLTYLIGFASAYGGWYWIARIFGLRGWSTHLPGLVFVTSASYLSTVYGLGDWPEFLAISAMPLMIAAGLAVLLEARTSIWAALALAGSAVVFFGSHVLSAIWGTTLLLLLSLATLTLIPAARRRVTRAGVLRVLSLLVPALLVNAWFLLPAAAYQSQTAIAHSYPHFRELLRASMYTVAARHLFTLSRARASGTVVTLALPLLAIAWALGSAAILLAKRRRGPWMRALLLLAGASAALLVLMTHAGLILALPRIYATLQFSFRLESYLLMCLSGTLLAALLLTGESTHSTRLMVRWRWLLAPLAAVSLFGAIEQVDAYPHGGSRGALLASYSSPAFAQEGLLDYVDDELPILPDPPTHVEFPDSPAPGERIQAPAPPGAGRRVDSNLRAAPALLDIQGARIVGTDSHADDVLEVDPPAREGGAAGRSGGAAHGASAGNAGEGRGGEAGARGGGGHSDHGRALKEPAGRGRAPAEPVRAARAGAAPRRDRPAAGTLPARAGGRDRAGYDSASPLTPETPCRSPCSSPVRARTCRRCSTPSTAARRGSSRSRPTRPTRRPCCAPPTRACRRRSSLARSTPTGPHATARWPTGCRRAARAWSCSPATWN